LAKFRFSPELACSSNGLFILFATAKGAFSLMLLKLMRLRMQVSLLLLLVASGHCMAQANGDICRTTKLVLKNLEKYHYSPPTFDAAARKEIVSLFIEGIDPYGFYFLGSDKKSLEDVAAMDGEGVFCSMIEMAGLMYRQRLQATDSFISNYVKAPMEFSNADTLYYSPRYKSFLAKDVAAQQNYLKKKIKLSVLTSMYEAQKDSASKRTEAQREEAARNEIQRKLRKHEGMLKERGKLERYVAEEFWNAMAHRCDPHSCYFNNSDKSDFEKQISVEDFSYGLVTKENDDGQVEIVRLIPGSPAWKANELNEGDVITAMTTDGKKVDLSTLTEEEINDLIESAQSKNILLTVKKKNSQEKKVSLRREKMQSQENSLNGYILKDDKISLGYIPLPAFYTNMEDYQPMGCSNDVAKEILKLKKENIDGLILDLRFNGGGAMNEAMSLAGIFIDEGPLGIEKSREGKPFTLRDFNRGTIYDGPLVVLVNGYSASASEFLSGVLQDYNRAVIVGAPTYGKGTAQSILLVDSTQKDYLGYKSGYLKLTEGKFYRVNSTSNQNKGIQPDVALPGIDIENYYDKESGTPYHLPSDTVGKKVVYNAGPAFPVSYLIEHSAARVKINPFFAKVQAVSDSISIYYKNDSKIAITKKAVNQYLQNLDGLKKTVNDLSDGKESAFKAINNKFEDKVLEFDEDGKKQNEERIKGLNSDRELEEACFILKDLINYSKPK
jgi:carboxyl-terminal processing protease